jgi:adenine-specific DNA-methyltransferase
VLEETSEGYKAGYRTIADICKSRITKVITKLQAERETATENTDLPKQALGFNCFKIAPSNFKKWRSDVENERILEQLDLHRFSEKPDSNNKNLLIELLLKSGRPLTAKVETLTIDGQELYNVESGSLLLFFDDYNNQVKELIFKLKPKRIICLDRVFKNDETLTNFQLNLKDAGIELQII